MSPEFSQEQLFIIGVVVSVLTFALNYLTKRQGMQIKRSLLTIILYAVSFVLALLFAQPALPIPPLLSGEPVTDVNAILLYLGGLLAVLTVIVGFATAIYNIIGQRVMESIANKLLGDTPVG